MMLDPVTIRELSNLKVQELLSQAETSRKMKALPAEPGFADSIVTMLSGLMRRVQPAVSENTADTYADARRATAEIPSL